MPLQQSKILDPTPVPPKEDLNDDHVKLLMDELGLKKADAERALSAVGGDLEKALRHAIA